MRINLICHYYPPEIGAPQARLSEMAREWVRQGHAVTVLTGMPNHPTGVVPPEYRGRKFIKEEVDGVEIWRHWLYATPNEGFVKKICAHLSFMVTLVLFSLFRGKKPDAFVVSSPNFFSVISTYIMSRVRRVPYVFEVRDLWPGIFVELGILKNRRLIRMIEMIELFLYRKAAAVVPVTEGFADDMVCRGISRDKIEVITNGVDLDIHRPCLKDFGFRAQAGVSRDVFLVLYMGAHGISHGLSRVIDAAKVLEDDREVHFLLVGEGAEKSQLMEKVRQKQLRNVTFISGQPHEKISQYYCVADVCLVPLRDVPGFSTFIPSKMFEIMGCGKPIIASLRGESANILSRSGAAVVIPPEDSDALVEAILSLKSSPETCGRMGAAGRSFVERNYDRRMLARKYLNLLGRVAKE